MKKIRRTTTLLCGVTYIGMHSYILQPSTSTAFAPLHVAGLIHHTTYSTRHTQQHNRKHHHQHYRSNNNNLHTNIESSSTVAVIQQQTFRLSSITNKNSDSSSIRSNNRPSSSFDFDYSNAENVKRCEEAYLEYSNACQVRRDATRKLTQAEMDHICAEANVQAAEATLAIARRFVGLTEAKAQAAAEAASEAAFRVNILHNDVVCSISGERALLQNYPINVFTNTNTNTTAGGVAGGIGVGVDQNVNVPFAVFHGAAIESGERSTAAGIAATIAMTAASDWKAADIANSHARAHLEACTLRYQKAHMIYLDACEEEEHLLPHVSAACRGTNVMKSHDEMMNPSHSHSHLGPPEEKLWDCVEQVHHSSSSTNGDLLTGPGMYYRDNPAITIVWPKQKQKQRSIIMQEGNDNDNDNTISNNDDDDAESSWREVERLSEEDPSNPVILWQIVKESSSRQEFIVMHRRKFLEQPLDGLTGMSAELYAKNMCIFPPSGTEPASPIHYRTDAKGWIDDVPGTYEYVAHDGFGEKSDRDYVDVKRIAKYPNAVLLWRNRAGVSWRLTPKAFPMLATGNDCPYFKDGYVSCPIVRDFHGDVLYLIGPFGEQYMRVSD